jgi:hypothetical protein
MLDSDGNPCNYVNFYRCYHEGKEMAGKQYSEWVDQWSCACNDRCTVCNSEIEPYESVDITDGNEKAQYIAGDLIGLK